MQTDKKLNIVIWAFPSWNSDYTKSTVELAKELALHHNVLYIDYAYTIKDVLTAKSDSGIPVQRIMHRRQSIKKTNLNNGGSILVLSLPPVLPFNWTSSKKVYRIIEGINNNLVSKRIRAALQALNFAADIVINAFNPFFGSAIPAIFPGVPVIYYCYDNIAASAWAAKHGGWLEKEFVQYADAVIFSSDALFQNKAWNKPGYVVKNGVDLRIFSKIEKKVSAALVATHVRKVIGYVGTVDDRLDFDMLERVAASNPQFEFHFIGRVITDKGEKLKMLPNVTYFGSVDPQMLPGTMQHFEAAIIPFVKNEFTRNIYPMKVNEYLAMGIPVVSTAFASFTDLSGFIEVADDALSFTAKLQEVMCYDDEQKKRQRIAKAYTNSWEQKSKEFETILMRYAG